MIARSRLAAAVVLGLTVAALAAPPAAAQDATPDVLRLCADPDNLPFSSDDPARKGFYLEIGDLIAKDLGIPTEVVWWRTYFGKRAVRLTLLAKRCDLHIGLPAVKGFMGRKVAFTKPFFATGYALVLPPGVRFTGLADLEGKTVGVVFNTPAQSLLALWGGARLVTFLDPDAAMARLAEGGLDAALIWGPSAGYDNRTRLAGAYQVIALAGPRMQWRVAIGVRGRDDALRRLLDREIDRLAPDIQAVAARYGLALAAPRAVDWDQRPKPAAEPETRRGAAEVDEPRRVATAPATPEDILRGRKLFNGGLGCSHCHGPNAVTADRKRDLRRLRQRNGGKADEVFRVTVLKGRPAKGMPTWEGMISAEEMAKVKAYLDSVQIN